MNIDNVIILGAGASFDAGIPLMNDLVEKMRWYFYKNSDGQNPLSENDKSTFQKAINIINELDNYHGRAAFDDRNIEDILSILAFNVLGGRSYTKVKLDDMIAAISRTIELSCKVKHTGVFDVLQQEGDEVYRDFWDHLFEKYANKFSFPTIITLNYDLVLERSLLQTISASSIGSLPFDGIILDYCYPNLRLVAMKMVNIRYASRYDIYGIPGYKLDICSEKDLSNPLKIEILKLHGSVNFPRTKQTDKVKNIAEVVNNAFIIPPISNKTISKNAESIWGAAMNRIRSCKNLFICGYSLPKSDVYFQFFLKSALGPNKDFERMFIFNPELFNETMKEEIKARYEQCFPEELRKRIVFRPDYDGRDNPYWGTFSNFVNDIKAKDNFLY